MATIPAYETYPRGHGLIGRRALSSSQTVVEAPAIVEDGAELWGSPVISGKSVIREGAVITGAPEICDVNTYGYVVISGKPIISISILAVDCIVTDEAYLYACDLRGKIRIGEAAILINCQALGSVIIRGSARVSGFKIPDGARIDEGDWDRPPLVVKTDKFNMTEASDGRVRIGCRAFSPRVWLNWGEKYGRVYGMDEQQIETYRASIGQFM